MKIAPSILAADFLNLEEELLRINQTNCQFLHLDVMDGHYVEEITFGYNLIKKIKKISKQKLDIHLMVSNPISIVNKLIDLNVDLITVHPETIAYEDFITLQKKCQAKNIFFGIAINPDKQIEEFKKYLEISNYSLIMSVFPGKGGQKFIENVLVKSQEIKEINSEILINIDGGINEQTILKIKKYPIDVVVSGSFLFKGDIQQNINKLK